MSILLGAEMTFGSMGSPHCGQIGRPREATSIPQWHRHASCDVCTRSAPRGRSSGSCSFRHSSRATNTTRSFQHRTQAQLTQPEKRIDRRDDVHFHFRHIAACFWQVRKFFLHLGQELLQANRQGLDLDFLDDQGDGPFVLPGLEVEHAFAGLANGIGGDMGDRRKSISVGGIRAPFAKQLCAEYTK